MTTQPLWGPPDQDTLDTVDAVDRDWRRDHDRERIDAAIRRVAARDGGTVDPNAVRAELTGPHGLVVNPRSLSTRYAALTRAGVLVETGEWVVSDDRAGRNGGKPLRLRRWVGTA